MGTAAGEAVRLQRLMIRYAPAARGAASAGPEKVQYAATADRIHVRPCPAASLYAAASAAGAYTHRKGAAVPLGRSRAAWAAHGRKAERAATGSRRSEAGRIVQEAKAPCNKPAAPRAA